MESDEHTKVSTYRGSLRRLAKPDVALLLAGRSIDGPFGQLAGRRKETAFPRLKVTVNLDRILRVAFIRIYKVDAW